MSTILLILIILALVGRFRAGDTAAIGDMAPRAFWASS